MRPFARRCWKQSSLCRVDDGATLMLSPRQFAARSGLPSPSVGARSPCATFTSYRYDAEKSVEIPMIGRLNHVAIAVRDIASASKVYRDTLGAEVSAQVPQPDHGVTTVFIPLPNTKIELLEPLGADSPIAKFLE